MNYTADQAISWTGAPPAHPFDPVRDPAGRLLRVAVDEAPVGVLVVSEDGNILLANQRAETIFDYGSGELVGRAIQRLLPHSWDHVREDLMKAVTEPQPAVRERAVTGLRNSGRPVPLEIELNLASAENSNYIVVSVRDAEERADIEARVASVASEYADFHRLIADIAARFVGVSHDQLDATIIDSLREICEALELDRGILWEADQKNRALHATHWWARLPDPPPPPLPMDGIPWLISKLEQGEVAAYERPEDVPADTDRETFLRRGPVSGAAVPLLQNARPGELGAIGFANLKKTRTWPEPILERLRLVGVVIGQALARRTSRLALEKALSEVNELRERLVDENQHLRRDVSTFMPTRPIVSESAAAKRALALVEQVAPTPSTVLLLGETGTGKELFAQAIHDLSPRHQRQMIRVSCAAIPSALIESELFGRERGAYTGALSRQIGRFEAAHQSTLFLDEIGDLPSDVQVKLLRVLQERVIERLGSTQPVKVDVRIIAATNRDLSKAVEDKTFREDLYYRLNVFPIVVPPLRERVEDIRGLVWAFIDEFSRAFGKNVTSISKESLAELERYPWPGNIRELRNVIERAMIVASGRQLVVPAPKASGTRQPSAMTLESIEVAHIRAVLDATNWRVRGSGGAAERLGLKPTTLESRMARLGIKRHRAS